MNRRDWLLDLINVALALLGVAAYCRGEEVEKKVTAVVFSQEGCAPCLKMKQQFKGSGLPVRFEERPEELRRMKIKSTPTTMILVNGRPTWSHVGYISAKDLRARISARGEK